MKTLTLTQPYATLIAIGAKRIESRSWSTSYRGPLAIHAAKGFPNSAKMMCEARSFCRIMGWPECPDPLTQAWLDDNARRIKTLPVGYVLATATLMNCIKTDLIRRFVQPFTEQEENFGDYSPGRYAWILEDVQALPEPIPARGWLSLWEWERPEQVITP